MALPNRAPDWSFWRYVPTLALHEGVALSLNIDPNQLRAPSLRLNYPGKPFEEGPEFQTRLDLARRCLGDTLPGPTNFAAVRYFDEKPQVRLREFAAWALSVKWQIPPELARLADSNHRSSDIADLDPNERLTLPEQVRFLAQLMPEERARARIEKAFRFREIPYQPEFAVLYDDAKIDWQSGRVVLPKIPRQPFIPTLRAVEFLRHFVPARGTRQTDKQEITTAPGINEASEGTPDDHAISHSGFPGRPGKAKHLIEDEFKRRTEAEEALPNLADEAAALFDWLKEAHPTVARPTKRTIENNIRDDHRRWRQGREADPP